MFRRIHFSPSSSLQRGATTIFPMLDTFNFKRHSSSSSKKQNSSSSIDSIIGRCVATNDYQKAIDTLMLQGSSENNNSSGSKISLSSLKATLFVCEQNNKHQEAINLAKKLDAEKRLADAIWQDEAALTTLLRLQAHVGDLDGAAICLKMILLNVVAGASKEKLKRRSVAPLIEAYRKRLVDEKQKYDIDIEKKKYYASCAMHLFGECRKHNVEFHVEDLENFAQIFQEVLVNDFRGKITGHELKQRIEEVRKTLTELIRTFVDHTPILGDNITINANDAKESSSSSTVLLLLEKFESILQFCEHQQSTRKFTDCEIDPLLGTCSVCKNRLDATPLTKDDALQLEKDIQTSLIQHACAKNPRRENAIRAGFTAFQNHIQSTQPTILLDGANLGYYGLSSWYHLAKQEKLEHEQKYSTKKETNNSIANDAKFDKKKLTFVDVSPNLQFVDLAFQEMEKRGKKPLVVLHERHLEPRNLLPSHVPIVEKWRKKRAVFATPSGLNDDICWLWGIVRSENCMVLTNDAMRDHHFALLSRRAFLRLRDRKQIKFSAKWTGSETQIFVDPAPVFSSFVQKNGREGKWHVPYYSKELEKENNKGGDDEDGKNEQEDLVTVKWKCF